MSDCILRLCRCILSKEEQDGLSVPQTSPPSCPINSVLHPKAASLDDMDVDSAGLTVLLNQYRRFEESEYNCSRLLRGELDLGDLDQSRACFDTGWLMCRRPLEPEKGPFDSWGQKW